MSEAIEQITVDKSNTAFCSINGDLYSKDGTVLICYAPAKAAKSFTVPRGVQKIHRLAFARASNLVDVRLPDGVVEIGYSAFELCRNLESINLPASLNKIGNKCFIYCYKLKSAAFDYPQDWKEDGKILFAAVSPKTLQYASSAAEFLKTLSETKYGLIRK